MPIADSVSGLQEPGMADMLGTSQTFDQDMSNIDFSAIGDMIDGPVDWDMWDDQIMQQHVQQAGSWDDSNFSAYQSNTDAMTQSVGAQYVQPVVPGNAIIMNGTAPVAHGAHPSMMFDWQDLEDVDLDIRDYGTGGFWGKTP